MKKISLSALLLSTLLALSLPSPAHAQHAVVAQPDHGQLLASNDPRLAANKKLVYDFWREVFEGGHMELADKYLTDDYIQHNPNVASGRAAFVEAFSRRIKPQTIEARVKKPLVAILAEGDLVMLSFVQEGTDPRDATKKYTTTWFDLFRVTNGKIVEHWDGMQKM